VFEPTQILKKAKSVTGSSSLTWCASVSFCWFYMQWSRRFGLMGDVTRSRQAGLQE